MGITETVEANAMILPHTPGTSWDYTIHGVVIPESGVSSAKYNHNAYQFAAACEAEGIPTGVPVSSEVYDLAEAAWRLRDAPSRRDRATLSWLADDGPCRDDAPEAWRRVREALAGMMEAEKLDTLAGEGA